MAKQPQFVRIRAYDVGFGDCFLLTFHYSATDERHVLIDFGSFPKARRSRAGNLLEIAKHIEATCNKHLTAVVATHRHADHINGFATKARGGGSGDVIRRCRPDLVIQPWTEDPDLGPRAKGILEPVVSNRQHIAALGDVRQFLGGMIRYLGSVGPKWRAVRKELAFLGENGIGNERAVTNLMTMAPKAKRRYVRFGSSSGLERLLPGVHVHVLGPPTIEQCASVEQARRRDESEFWQLFATNGSSPGSKHLGSLFSRKYTVRGVPGYARWFRDHADVLVREELLSIVRRMDEVLNNTSVILLFAVGPKKLLFPGDAQIENWGFALGKRSVQRLIAGVDVYKVGHHGSLNATPKQSLWERFTKRGHAATSLMTFLSTEAGHHGSTKSKTEVPRRTLVDALESESRLRATDHDGRIVQEKVAWVEDTVKVS